MGLERRIDYKNWIREDLVGSDWSRNRHGHNLIERDVEMSKAAFSEVELETGGIEAI